MEMKDLANFALIVVFVGLIIGVGVLVLNKFGDAVKTSTTIDMTENVTLAGGIGTLTNDEVTSFIAIGNSTINFTIGTQANLTSGEAGTILVAYPEVANGSYTVAYIYDADSATTTALGSAETSVGGIATNWLGLMVTCAMLAIILGLVIKSFTSGRQ